jgi:hypothetical protein
VCCHCQYWRYALHAPILEVCTAWLYAAVMHFMTLYCEYVLHAPILKVCTMNCMPLYCRYVGTAWLNTPGMYCMSLYCRYVLHDHIPAVCTACPYGLSSRGQLTTTLFLAKFPIFSRNPPNLHLSHVLVLTSSHSIAQVQKQAKSIMLIT